jgi:uncharacterized protein DUF1572
MSASPVTEALTKRFEAYKQMAEKAFSQISDPQLHQALDDNTNSVAVTMKHVAGNLRSRFTDFFTTDGEKPNRNRDSEFVDHGADRVEMIADWESGWQTLFTTLAAIADADLQKIVKIRGESHTVIDALVRALAHMTYHVGQIVQLSRHLAKDKWTVLTIPRGGSNQFNDTMKQKFKS